MGARILLQCSHAHTRVLLSWRACVPARISFHSRPAAWAPVSYASLMKTPHRGAKGGHVTWRVLWVCCACVRACARVCKVTQGAWKGGPRLHTLLAREQLEDVRVFHRQKAPCSHYLRAQPIKCAAICNLCQWEEAPCASLQEPVPVYRTASTGMSHGNRLGGPPHVSGQWPSRLPRVHQFRTTTMPNHHNTLPLSQFQKFLALSSSKPLAPVPPTVPSSRRLLPAYGRAGGVLKAV